MGGPPVAFTTLAAVVLVAGLLDGALGAVGGQPLFLDAPFLTVRLQVDGGDHLTIAHARCRADDLALAVSVLQHLLSDGRRSSLPLDQIEESMQSAVDHGLFDLENEQGVEGALKRLVIRRGDQGPVAPQRLGADDLAGEEGVTQDLGGLGGFFLLLDEIQEQMQSAVDHGLFDLENEHGVEGALNAGILKLMLGHGCTSRKERALSRSLILAL